MANGSVWPVVVVVVQEVHQCHAAVGLGLVFADIGPLSGQCSVESLDLAVGAWRVGLGALVDGLGQFEGCGPSAGAVAGAIVGECPLDVGDPVLGVERGGAEPEICGWVSKKSAISV